MSDCFRSEEEPNVKKIEDFKKSSSNEAYKIKLAESFQSIKSQTVKEEFLRRIRVQLVVDVARFQEVDCIFMASCGTKLASQLITDVAQGKGNQIHLETVRILQFT